MAFFILEGLKDILSKQSEKNIHLVGVVPVFPESPQEISQPKIFETP